MSEEANRLRQLLRLSEVDIKVARASTERKKAETELASKQQQLKQLESESKKSLHAFQDRKGYYDKEEKYLKDEQQKLVERRRALKTLSNYKLQAAGEREIEHAAKLLSAHEETLIAVLDEVELLQKTAEENKQAATSLKSELGALETETAATIKTIDERIADYKKERAQLSKDIDSGFLNAYERVRERYPMDPLAAVRQGNCSGCYFELGRQIVVQISRGASIVKCGGCARILYLEDTKEE